MSRRVVLLGTGHAHLFTLKRARAFAQAGHELVAVAPEPFWYSGLATGMLGGTYPPELDRIDIAGLMGDHGRFVRDRATGIDRANRLVHLQDGPPLRYDLLSVNLGSVAPTIPGAGACHAVKPIPRLLDLRLELEARLGRGEQVRVAVAGGGTTGVELAGNIEGLARRHNSRVAVTLLASGGRILERLPAGMAEGVAASLERRGIKIRTHSRVKRVENGTALLEGGGREPFDLFVNAGGLLPAPEIRRLGLPVDGSGALRVDRHLRSLADPAMFGGGDAVCVDGHDLPKVGVYAIRQAPVLFHNLLATLAGESLRAFIPQRRYLWIMNLGDGTGLAAWNGFWWQGRAAFWLKDRIDRSFLDSYRAGSPASSRTRATDSSATS
ncbi:NAD(P)/FAD-dependent oxidoreductase [Geminicoccus roseus]|uniref:NAD(P)/FAD-dependent oxidoreductase n=1 Tax=Geminicoccus roseus TaxID=404900 RepID=UPI000687ACB1|nr:FAD-dependent oxidoreductase [Geminicoccus roseus]